MKANYKNWVPKGMLQGLCAGSSGMAALALLSGIGRWPHPVLPYIFGTCAVILLLIFLWMLRMYRAFDYNGRRQLSRQVIEGIASYVKVPSGGSCLDVGCGSGALTIAAARRNPSASVTGIDRWGKEYASFSRALCEENARAEGVSNVKFSQGDALHLGFPDESFDAVTSNYVYHNISGVNKQDCLLETLRVLKKGGSFAIHDLMSPKRYGDMDAFQQKLKDMGYQEVKLIDTTQGMFMSPKEARQLSLTGSCLLVGTK